MTKEGRGIQLKREGYYTSPPFHQLKNYTECGIYVVEKLTVGRNGFGSITFDGPVNIKDLNFDDIVLINHKEVTLYPDEKQKPPAGHGLNCAAEVRLEKVWPFNGCTSKYITDPQILEEISFEKKLREANQKCSATFLKYIPETGSWIFKVEHFSKYGYYDTDDETDEKEERKDQVRRLAKEKAIEPVIHIKKGITDVTSDGPDGAMTPQVAIQKTASSVRTKGFTQGELQFIGQHHDEDDVEMKEDYPATSDIVSHITDAWLKPFCAPGDLNISQEKLLSMKRTFFPEDKESVEEDLPDEVPVIVKTQSLQSHLTNTQTGYYEGSDGPKLLRVFHKYNLCLEDECPAKVIQRPAKKKMVSSQPVQTPVEETDRPKGPLKHWPQLRSITGLIKTAMCGPQMKLQERSSFQTCIFKYPSQIVPLHRTATKKIRSQSIRDLNLFKGRSFRVGWGPGSVLLILTTQKSATAAALEAEVQDLDKYLKGRPADDTSKQIVQRICLRGGKGLTGERRGRASHESELRDYLKRHLNVKLKHSDFYQDKKVPGIKPVLGSAAVAFHDCLRLTDDCEEREYTYNIWSLCNALWGDLPEYVPPVNSHHNLMLRKQYLGDWLTSVFHKGVLSKCQGRLCNAKIESTGSYLEDIWNLVTANMIKDACNLARRNGDTFLVTLLTQLASSQYVNYLIRDQLTSWINFGADVFIKRDRLKIFLLLCSTALYNGKEETVNVCERLDWKRSLGLHLWYLTSGVQTIKDAFTMYQKAFHPQEFRDLYAKAPFPPYSEEGYIYDPQEKLPPLDLCYHLIHLYCDRFYSMTKIFDPVTHTLDVLDYSLSWLVYISLHAVGYHHTSEYGAAQLHSSFAAQLESYGMWHWAIFVLLHIPDTARRQMAVIHVLERNLNSDGDREYRKKECFVKKVLKVPATWIYRIKADRAFGQGKYHFAVCFLNKAKHFNLAHKVFQKHLAPHYVVNERYGVLIKLLKPLAIACKKRNYVSNWEKGGYIIWLYLKVMTKIKYMLKHPEFVDGYQLESVQVDAIKLCKQLPQLTVSTVMDRLCRIDLSERIFDLVGEFVKLQKDDQVSCRIILFMTTKLPMPDNFRVIERRNFLKKWPENFATCRLFT